MSLHLPVFKDRGFYRSYAIFVHEDNLKKEKKETPLKHCDRILAERIFIWKSH